MTQDRAVCVIPPSGWVDSSNKLSEIAKKAVREQSFRHSPLADSHVHQKVLHQQREARNTHDFVRQSDVRNIKELSFCLISSSNNGSKPLKTCERSRGKMSSTADSRTSKSNRRNWKNVENTLKDYTAFRTIMKNEISRNSFQLFFAIYVVLSGSEF